MPKLEILPQDEFEAKQKEVEAVANPIMMKVATHFDQFDFPNSYYY